MPLIILVMVTPVVAIAPALVVAFGFGMMPKYIVTALVVFFPMLVNSFAGLRGRRPASAGRDSAPCTPAGGRSSATCGSPAACRTSSPDCASPAAGVVGAAVAEFVAAGTAAGLGSLVTISAAQANLPVTWASHRAALPDGRNLRDRVLAMRTQARPVVERRDSRRANRARPTRHCGPRRENQHERQHHEDSFTSACSRTLQANDSGTATWRHPDNERVTTSTPSTTGRTSPRSAKTRGLDFLFLADAWGWADVNGERPDICTVEGLDLPRLDPAIVAAALISTHREPRPRA